MREGRKRWRWKEKVRDRKKTGKVGWRSVEEWGGETGRESKTDRQKERL